MVGPLLRLIDELVGGDPQQRRFVVRVLWVAFVTTHIAWASGWLLVLGMGGFARAADLASAKAETAASLDAVNRSLGELRVTSLQAQMLQVRTLQCAAILGERRDAARFYAQHLRELERIYQEVTRDEWNEPPCGEL